MSVKDFKRSLRVAERIRSELMNLLLRGVVRDPRAEDVVVSDVKVTDDLGIARVYVRLMGEVPTDRQEEVVDALSHAKGFIRHELGQHLGLKRVPDLEFFWDEVIDSALRLEGILSELDDDDSDTERDA